MSKLTDKQKNFNNFIQIVQNEFPKALRQVFETMWNQTYQPWDDSPTVRSIFLSLEGGKTKIPLHLSYEEWDTTSLLLATLYSRAFSVQGYGAGHTVTLSDMYVRPRKLPLGSFHATVSSPTGNRLETIALAIDQLRLLRNTSAHWRGEAEMEKPMFDQYLLYVRDAFHALGLSTDNLDFIGNPQLEFSAEGLRSLVASGNNRHLISYLPS